MDIICIHLYKTITLLTKTIYIVNNSLKYPLIDYTHIFITVLQTLANYHPSHLVQHTSFE